MTPDVIDEVIQDVTLESKGAKLYYVVDPFEIIQFCFPVTPGQPSRRTLEQIADDQAALYEVFYTRTIPPLLFNEYVNEIVSHLAYVTHSVELAYSKTKLVDEMISQAHRRPTEFRPPLDGPEDLIDDFNIALAVTMGIYNLGVERFVDVEGKLREGSANLPTVIRGIAESYKSSFLVGEIFDHIVREVHQKRLSKSVIERSRRAAKKDALVIDKVLYFNTELEKAYREKRLDHRVVFLYLSSAERTRSVFTLPSVASRSPRVGSRVFSPHRTRSHIFAFLIHKGRGVGNPFAFDKVILALTDTKETLLADSRRLQARMRPTGEDCQVCILQGGASQECPWIDTCRKVQELDALIHGHRHQIQNLALMSVVNDYRTLVQQKPPQDDYDYYFQQVRKVIADNKIRDYALEKIRQLQRLLRAQIGFADLFKPSEATTLEMASLRFGRDAISGTDQYLPIKPNLRSPAYWAILVLLICYYRTPIGYGPTRYRFLEEAFDHFIYLESKLTQLTGEHELVRCFLYLTHPSNEGDELAFQHAKDMSLLYKDWEREYLYLQCWAGRRLKRFPEAERIATAAIEHFPEDPRFYHGRSLIYFAWKLSDEEAPEGDAHLGAAIHDAEKAIGLYSSLTATNADMIAVNYNNIAYFHVLDKRSRSYDLAKAHRSFDQVEKHIARPLWETLYPEYLHTDALIQYLECARDLETGADKVELKLRLEDARLKLEIAIKLYPKPPYDELLRRIKSALHSI